ncbi:SPFH domain-containing protein [Collinsella sp. OM08-14AT]|uniref:SPFH domain-containing protein n=1 Tax=Collinsella sp. OM08-14AT TaxID=2292329 RepID=UPI000E431192|nr:SPFH domain-containing protein [Collinsella sp. OM08-14AT]RGM31482.1 hypothetical protein DXC18_06735 [Collinsella sp. OM08-14AT]
MFFESVIFSLLPIIVGILVVAMVFESCWRKCPPDKLMIVSGAGKMRSVSGKGTFVIPLLQRVDTLSLGAVQVQLTTENEIPTQDAILIHACAVANNGMDNPYLLANRYIDIMPKVAEQVAKPLTAVDSIKMYGSGNAQKLVKETTSIVDQVASGLKDSTGIDLPSLLNGLLSNPDIDADSAENSVE